MSAVPTGRRIARVLAAGALGGLAGLAFGPVVAGLPDPVVPALAGPPQFLFALLAVVATAVAVGLLAALRPAFPPALAALGGTVAVAAVIAAVLRPGTAVVDGARQLLASALPAHPTGPTLATVAALTGWGALATTLLAAYARRPLAAAGPGLAVLVCALAVGASAPALPVGYGVSVAAALAALLATGATPVHRGFQP